MGHNTNKVIAMARLAEAASNCRQCPMMDFRRTFLNHHNGNIEADIMFIGEATALGSPQQLSKPFNDSKSGDNFNLFLRASGVNRDHCFVTNTVLHTPLKPNGNFRSPSSIEMEHCQEFLKKQIQIVDPLIVVALGSYALKSLNMIYPHSFSLKRNAGQNCEWNRRYLHVCYHPSPTVTPAIRTYEEQIADYLKIQVLLKKVKKYR